MDIRLVVHHDQLKYGYLFNDSKVMTFNCNTPMKNVFEYACTLANVEKDKYMVHSRYKYDGEWELRYWATKNNDMKSFLYDYMLAFEIVPI